jgi:hypothetical protein
MDKYYILKNDFIEQKQRVIENIINELTDNIDNDIEIIINKKRTLKQNNSLHKYFELVSDALNEKGLDFTQIFKNTVAIMITPAIVKECMWKPIQKSMFKKESTTKLNKKEEIDKIYDVMNKFLSEKFEIYIEFPNKEK